MRVIGASHDLGYFCLVGNIAKLGEGLGEDIAWDG
jgi:hypothetical protein